MATTYQHHSGRAKCERRGRVVHIDYSGMITLDGIHHLDRIMQHERVCMAHSIERMDCAVTTFDTCGTIDRDVWHVGIPPSAVIVRPDQYQASLEFCRLLARLGVDRMCWLEHQIPIANLWLAQLHQNDMQTV